MPSTELLGFVLPPQVRDHLAGRTPLLVPFRPGAHALSPDLPVLEQSLRDGITLLEFRGADRPFPALTGWDHSGPTAAVSSDCLAYGAEGLLLVSHAYFPPGADVRTPIIPDGAWTTLDGRWTQETPNENFVRSLRAALDRHGITHRGGAIVSGRAPDSPERHRIGAWDEHTVPFLHEAWRRGVPGASILVNAADPRHYRALWPALAELLGRAG